MSSKMPSERAWDEQFELQLSPEMEAEVLAYSQRRYEDSPSLNAPENKEALARQKEMSIEMSKPYRWTKQEELAEHPSRIGRIIHAGEFLTDLRNKCHLQCWYTGDPATQRGLLALTVMDPSTQRPRALCGVQPGAMPEFSVMNFDEYGAPTNEKHRGWRTVLLRLILERILTEQEVSKAFGYPEGEAGRRYRETLHSFRNVIVE